MLINEAEIPNVVSGFNPVMFLATSIGSTFARLRQKRQNVNEERAKPAKKRRIERNMREAYVRNKGKYNFCKIEKL